MIWLDHSHCGDCRDLMRTMIADGVRVQTIVTSPPYWGLRSYLPDDHPDKTREIGQEPTLREFIDTLVGVFDLARELLADDGTLWMNMGDGYIASAADRIKPKDLSGQPWRLAFALQDAGWYLRQDIIWAKPNPMPESVRDRCTKAHEYLFLLSKSERYYFDTDAMREPRASNEDAATFRGGCYVGGDIDNAQLGQRKVTGNRRMKVPGGWDTAAGAHGSFHRDGRGDAEYRDDAGDGRRMRRSVWTIATQPYAAAHFATFPEALVEPCVLAGSRPSDIVFDPFFGSGTTGQVAQRLGRCFIGCELNPEYSPLQRDRLRQPGLRLEVA